ncbi:MFS transporter [Hyperthermus butylicus]|nr:MFS transporter [Hyperthermus butylicus]
MVVWGMGEDWLDRLWPVLVAAFASQVIGGLLWSVYAPFLRGQGFSGTLYGVIGSVSVFSSVAGSLVGGWVSDRYGSRGVIIAGVVSWSVGAAVLSLGGLYPALASSVLSGFGGGAVWVAVAALVSRTAPDAELDKAFSYMNAANLFGGALGSFMGWLPIIYSRATGAPLLESYRLFLAVGAAVLLAVTLPLYARVREPRAACAVGVDGPRRRVSVPWRTIYKLFLVELVIGFGAALSIHNIDYYFALKYGVTSAELGTTFGVQEAAMGVLTLYMPRFSRRVGGPLRTYLVLTGSSVPLLVAMTLVDSFPVAAALYIVRTILMNVASPLYQAFQMSLIPWELRGRGSSLLGLAWQVPVGLGRSVGGALLDIDVELPLRVTALLYTAALSMLAAFFPDHLRKRSTAATHRG